MPSSQVIAIGLIVFSAIAGGIFAFVYSHKKEKIDRII